MAEHFFPRPKAANISDITEVRYPKELNGFAYTITRAEVEETIGKLPRDKAPCPDGIPNRLLR